MGERSSQNCVRCGAAPVVEAGLCADCSEVGYDGLEDEDDLDTDDEDDELLEEEL